MPSETPNVPAVSEQEGLDAARELVHRFLGLCCGDPMGESWAKLHEPGFADLCIAAAEHLALSSAAQQPQLGHGELPPESLDLRQLVSALSRPKDDLIAEYDGVFGLLTSRECPPYETEYCPQTFSVYRSGQLADVAGFYQAFGLTISGNRPDHVSFELGFMSWLVARERHARVTQRDAEAKVCRDAQRKFVADHLAWWVPAFALALRQKADGLEGTQELQTPARSYYGAVGRALAALMAIERAVLDIPPPTELVAPNPAEEESALDSGESCPLADTCGAQ